MTDRHVANRVAMAGRLADFLQAANIVDVELVGAAGDDWWEQVARQAGEQRTPSAGTRACVLVALRERQRPLDASLLEGLPR